MVNANSSGKMDLRPSFFFFINLYKYSDTPAVKIDSRTSDVIPIKQKRMNISLDSVS